MRLMLLFVLLLGSFPQIAAADSDYLIGKGDVLQISVWGVADMSRSVVVRPDGKITLPAIGDVVAAGVTPSQLSSQLSTAMKNFIKEPIVTVSVEQIRNNRVYITGGNVSRVFDMVKETSLLKLLSELGDLSAIDLRQAYLSRKGKILFKDFYALYYKGDFSQDQLLQAEDIIFLPSNVLNQVYVLGAVVKPQKIQYFEGMTVLDAILAAGGFTEFAKDSSVYLINKQQQKKKLNLENVRRGKDLTDNVALNPGDYVVVEESIF
ncbi:XrtA/PEP-CTERM system exopolysaccharide export protein [Geopsychrobacter electrodiphilus]|uniref:XrtA/PEP-CTERM system exopolysaccharide export protein n=1 Tax=Geopsychrobacter electrodiphilus TaxID=225196 RepID=UPI000475F8A8|nr:XrtA/PEP-CTERM system exopolysaccharide export protein [Geopsychrobacter electrodiphilus]